MPPKIQRARSRTATLIETRSASVIIRLGDIDITIPNHLWDDAIRDYITFLAQNGNITALHEVSLHISSSIETGVSA